jgi:CRP-like cAMP-binding protein
MMKSITQNLPKCKSCVIRSSALFGELETNQLDKARALRSSQFMYKSGEHLYREGDIADHAFTLYDGWIILYKSLENGNRQILRFALPGDFLCYKIGKNRILDHSAVAVSDITLCAFPIDRFRSTIAELPDLALALGSMTTLLSERCHTVLTTIASHPAESKVAFLLLSLFIREYKRTDKKDDYCVPFPITQEDIGDALGLTSIHVNRVLQSLRKQNLIECKNKCLKVPDQIALAKVAKIGLIELQDLMLGAEHI